MIALLVGIRPHLAGKTQGGITTLPSMMNDKLSQQKFWPCHESQAW